MIVLLYHSEKKSLLFVKQFRPVVYYSKLKKLGLIRSVTDGPVESSEINLPSSKIGETLELCAGIIDGVQKNPKLYAVQEVLEECGYKINEDSLHLINSFYSSVGLAGTEVTLYYAEVHENQKVPNAGGGLHEEGEYIEVIEWPISRIEELFQNGTSGTHQQPTSLSLLKLVFLLTEIKFVYVEEGRSLQTIRFILVTSYYKCVLLFLS
ncbi:Nudix hydrolase 14, chloroplastic, variant 2 [Schistosoma haematobium]|uniref:Nudix hydrolase 14, chloroplastic, variant 2 n=1 Tax=Schistosoma haematobium TaxID=6185 RepID=A0A922LUN5_SCHHA|nr:Nudix hydrolase 14, chloroplastic, variant 2 [Schistosoma haematobium]KAH9593968.1 Nudix hydrolase 14, chloroplastic, variant 2 [Schistosoma haematobium]